MLTHHRNRGIIQLCCALALTGLLVGLWRRDRLEDDDWFMPMLLLYVGAVIAWWMAGFSFAKAKGYEGDRVTKVFWFLLFLGCFIPIASLLFPAFVIFGLRDKHRSRRSRHR